MNNGWLSGGSRRPGRPCGTAVLVFALLALPLLVGCNSATYLMPTPNVYTNPDVTPFAEAAKQGLDASLVALALFPQVIDTMAKQPDSTHSLGVAFKQQRDDVCGSVQSRPAGARLAAAVIQQGEDIYP